jgi:hypothetical protein
LFCLRLRGLDARITRPRQNAQEDDEKRLINHGTKIQRCADS